MRDAFFRTLRFFPFLWKKFFVMGTSTHAVWLLSAIVLGGGCDLQEMNGIPARNRAETVVRRRDPAPEEDPSRRPEALWISGVEYPAGYDWQRDPAYGKVGARLFLLRDGEKILDIPAGDDFEVSTDPDMHRMAGGHLYTDYSSGTETVVRRDGQELFRFRGREMLVGFLVRGTSVWTLGVSRASAKGIVLRENGTPVFSDPEGQLPPGFANTAFEGGLLHRDGDELFFFYRSADGWFRVRGPFAEPISLPAGFSDIYDIRRIGGKTVIAGAGPGRPLFLTQDGQPVSCAADGSGVRNVSLIPDGQRSFFLRGDVIRGSRVTATAWAPDGKVRLSVSDPVLGFYFEPDRHAYVAGNADGTPVRFVKDGDATTLPGRHLFIARRCALLRDGIFYLLLTPADRERPPFLLRDGVREEPLTFNGFYTGVVRAPQDPC